MISLSLLERTSLVLYSTIIFFFFFSFRSRSTLSYCFVALLNCVPFDGAFLELTGRLRAEQKSVFFLAETFRRRIKLQHEIERKLSRKIDFPSIVPFSSLFFFQITLTLSFLHFQIVNVSFS